MRGSSNSVARGDEAAFSHLYDETSTLVYSLAIRILGNVEDAEEVTLDVYNQIWKIARTMASRASVRGRSEGFAGAVCAAVGSMGPAGRGCTNENSLRAYCGTRSGGRVAPTMESIRARNRARELA